MNGVSYLWDCLIFFAPNIGEWRIETRKHHPTLLTRTLGIGASIPVGAVNDPDGMETDTPVFCLLSQNPADFIAYDQ